MTKRARRRAWRSQLSRSELLRGRVFFVLYIVVLPFLMAATQWLFDKSRGLYLSDASANVIYYGICAVLTLFVFWGFLKSGFFLLQDWLPENLFAFFTGLLGWAALYFAARRIPLPVQNPSHADYAQQFLIAPGATVVILVLLMPLVEEPLFRGVIFGSLRRSGRLLAYLLSALLFSLYSVWQFAFVWGDWRYLLLGVQYLPAGLALSWCYDNGGSIWSAVFLHMLINALLLHGIVR